MAADGVGPGVIGPDEPGTVPAGVLNGFGHLRRLFPHVRGFGFFSDMLQKVRKFVPVLHVHARNEDGLGHGALGRT